ncbi:MAG: tetratricopeptide repeat protein [Chitinophagales bacterium]
MKIPSFIYAILYACLSMGIAIPDAYGQKEIVDSLPMAKPASSAHADGLYFDAIKAKMHDDGKKAGELFSQFIALNPKVPAAYYELSTISYNDKKLEEADEYIKKALILNPDNKWYKEQHASILADKGDFPEAATIMAELSKSEPQDRTYPLMAAEYYDHAHKYEEAISYLNLAITRNGPDEEILMRKVQLYLSMNDVEKAAGAMREIIAQEPENGKYYKSLGELYDNNKLPEKAKEVYDNAQKILPGDPYILLGVAEHYLKIGDTASYMGYGKKAITSSDFDADIQTGLLKTYLQTMPNDSAVKVQGLPIIRQIVIQHPHDADAWAFFGDLLDFNNQRDSALIAYKRSLAIKPSGFNVWEILLRSYQEVRDADSLIKYSEKAIRLFPNNAHVHYYNSIGHMNRKEYPAAVKAINRAIDMQSENNKQALLLMYSLQAEIYHNNKQDNLSDQAFDKALQIDPNDATVLNNYSYYLSERGIRLNEAGKMSKKSLDIRPGEATFLDTYGWILYKQENYEKAKEYIQQAVDRSGVNADATLYDHLGNIYYKLNDKDKAMQYWKMSKEKGCDDPLLDKKINEGKLYE